MKSQIKYLWPTPILERINRDHSAIKAGLVDLLYAHRDKHTKNGSPLYASQDNLHVLYKDDPVFSKVNKFIMDSVFEIAAGVNGPYWKNSQGIDVALTGVWFQISNGYGFHETHIHGNCAWSGVYYIQAGESSRHAKDRKNGLLNGITRFYGPYMEFLAGGHGEFGNFYLEDKSWDSYPEDGKIAVFPSYLKHMVFPYNGEQDRIIISFHAQVSGMKEQRPGYEFN